MKQTSPQPSLTLLLQTLAALGNKRNIGVFDSWNRSLSLDGAPQGRIDSTKLDRWEMAHCLKTSGNSEDDIRIANSAVTTVGLGLQTDMKLI